VILVSVGTFVRGFDALVEAADAAVGRLDVEGFAQIGHSSVHPRHLAWARFLPEAELCRRLRRADVVVCHGGMGILGQAMRAGRPIVAVPRRGATTARNPANDQAAFLERLAERYPIRVCRDAGELTHHLAGLVEERPARIEYRLGSDVPRLIGAFLAANP
jgi:UDP-N-acetylglucosamine transferase subunit ALG13